MSTQLTKGQRVMRASKAAHTRWYRTEDRTAATALARSAFMNRFYDEVDPERRLATDERERRADSARRAHMTGLALRSSKARQRKRGSSAREK